MARYIDAELLLTDEMTHTLPNGCGKASGNVVVFVDDIEKLPTADVVPKSEVAEIIEETFRRIRENFTISELGKSALSELKNEFKKKYTEEI